MWTQHHRASPAGAFQAAAALRFDAAAVIRRGNKSAQCVAVHLNKQLKSRGKTVDSGEVVNKLHMPQDGLRME
jgi:hypothetical protein